MKALMLEEIAKAIGSKNENFENITVGNISTDTRTLKKGDLFFALKGKKRNGHDFIQIAEKKGACAVVCSEEIETSLPILKVSDTLLALQNLASYYRGKIGAKVIAVTGSTGKTTTKSMIANILSRKFKVFAANRNFNNEIGLPKSILELDDSYDFAVLEMGMNHLGEIENLSKIAKPDIAVITNIGKAHIGNLGSLENIFKAKLEILKHLKPGGTVVLNSDDEILKNFKSSEFEVLFAGLKKENNPDIFAENIKNNEFSSHFEVDFKNSKFEISLPILGKQNILNSLLASLVCLKLGFTGNEIASALECFAASPMRSEVSFVSGVKIIKDYYNASPESSKVAIENLANIKNDGKKIAILGEISELGSFSAEEHFNLAVCCCKNQIDHAFFIGEDFKSFKDGMKKHSDCFGVSERGNMLDCLKNYVSNGKIKSGDTVLIKGSRNMRMEEIYESLKRFLTGEQYIPSSLSSTRLYVDVNAIKYNFMQIKNAVGSSVEIMPMVKANAYGIGSDIIANLFSGCKYLAVADVKEAFSIKNVLPNANIVIIYQPAAEDIPEIVRGEFIPAVSDINFAKKLNEKAKNSNKIIRVHVEFDTGHGRLGLNLPEISEFAKEILKLENIKVEGLFMHYSSADALEDSDIAFTKLQTKRFEQGIADFEDIYGKVKYKHACAGAAIFNENAKHFNMVRPGYILYGYYPCDFLKERISLKPCLKFTSSVLQIREVESGTPISYNRRFTTDRKTKVATIGIGYSDGIFRSLFNKKNPGCFVINGQRAPIIGTICMDLTMIDITDIKGEVKVGDEVAIFDNINVTVDEMAEICGTIGYEIISRIAEKADRVETF